MKAQPFRKREKEKRHRNTKRGKKLKKRERNFQRERERTGRFWWDNGKKKDIKRGGVSPPKRFGWRPCRRAKNEGGNGENTKRETNLKRERERERTIVPNSDGKTKRKKRAGMLEKQMKGQGSPSPSPGFDRGAKGGRIAKAKRCRNPKRLPKKRKGEGWEKITDHRSQKKAKRR